MDQCLQWYFTQSGHLKWCNGDREVFTLEGPFSYFDRVRSVLVLANGKEIPLLKTEREKSSFLKQQTLDWLAKLVKK